MAQVINSNVLSLTAQRNLNKSQSSLNTAIQRLSSGLRINSAKDDAAGLAITDRMTSQIRGLNQAVRNANDGISLAQTAEGALSESSNNLQRIRELAIQSANSTNSSSDRAALNSEVQQLLSEIQRTATTTQFNGQNIIDGSFQSSQFQVGANANQTINVSVDGATTNLLGAYQATGTTVNSSAFDGDSFTVNGIEVGVSVATSAAGFTADSAAAKAAAINGKTSETGVTATAASSVVGGGPVARTSLANGALLVNGVSIGAIASSTSVVTQGRNAADAINAVTSQTGVSAVANATTGALTLSTTDGRNIALTSNPASAAGAQAIQNATGLDVSAGANASGNAVSTLTVTAASIAANETYAIGGVTYEFVATTGDPITAGNVEVVIGTGGTADNDTASNLQAAIAAQYTAGNTSLVATVATNVVTVTADQLGTATTAGTDGTGGAIVNAVTATGTAAADGTGVTTRGTLTLSSSENFTLGGTDLAFAGLGSANPTLTKLNAVDISTVAGSNSALSIIDGALAQISSNRADLGAVQNRFESTMANLSTASENLSAARSRILDADFAAETANLTRAQILQQAGVAMVSQANALPQSVLSLLQ